MKNKKTITILICALNEEKNIGNLLNDINIQALNEGFNNAFHIENIFVVSDGSTDKTIEIVEQFKRNDDKIILLINENREGKIFSMDRAFKLIQSDYVILFDADVRLKPDTIQLLTRPLLEKSFDLIGGNPVPFKNITTSNFAAQASLFSWQIVQNIKKNYPLSIYSAHGRILLISKEKYKNLNINALSTPGDDQYLYLKCKHNFYYSKDSIVNYVLPNSVSDYIKQNVRFRKAKKIRFETLDVDGAIHNEFKINDKFIIFLKTFLQMPYSGFLWIILYTVGYLKFKFYIENNNDINIVWSEVKSTK